MVQGLVVLVINVAALLLALGLVMLLATARGGGEI